MDLATLLGADAVLDADDALDLPPVTRRRCGRNDVRTTLAETG
jgi:hypothetical protein